MLYKKSYFFLLLLGLLTPSICLAVTWNLKRDYGETQVYISPNQTRLSLSFSKTPFKKKKFTKKLLDTLIKEKRQLLKQANIIQWTIDDKQIIEKRNYTRIDFTGFYKNIENQIIYFKEYHFYGSNKKLQILLTNTHSLFLKRDATLSHILSFKIKYKFNKEEEI